MAPGTKISQAQDEGGTRMRQLLATANDLDERLGVSVTPAIGISDRNYFGDRKYFVLLTRLLTTIGGILLLILCANLGGFLIAGANARSAQLASRQALGASPASVIRPLLTW